MNEVDSLTADQRMLLTATELFKRNGIQATGIEQIIEESGSARGTLYHHFGSKAGLVAAALDAEGVRWREWFFSELESRASSPQGQLLAIFDAMQSWFREKGYTGCLFMNAIAECRSQDEAVRQATLRHKRMVNDRIRRIAKAAGAHDPKQLTQQLDLLLDGLIITALVTKSTKSVAQGRIAAEILIESSLAAN
ncbi:MAG: TetR/AcrR family transcriptional regulator [Rubripirellula sp.]